MIDKGNSLLIWGMPNLHIAQSHAWNIDGYSSRERTVITKIYEDNVLVSQLPKIERKTWVHCDFGQKEGLLSGYFVSGVFKLDDSRIVFDNYKSQGASDANYCKGVHIITYNK